MSKILCRFNYDCGRMGSLDGIFVTTKNEFDKCMGHEVYYDDILGKHSEICFKLEEKFFQILTDDQSFIEKFEELKCGTGICPFDSVEFDEDEDEDEDNE